MSGGVHQSSTRRGSIGSNAAVFTSWAQIPTRSSIHCLNGRRRRSCQEYSRALHEAAPLVNTSRRAEQAVIVSRSTWDDHCGDPNLVMNRFGSF